MESRDALIAPEATARPGLGHLPGSGSPLELLRFLLRPVPFLERRFAEHGEVFRTHLGGPVAVLVGPEANKHLLVSGRDLYSHRGGYERLPFGRVFADSLPLQDGAEHAHDRDILQPAMGRLALAETIDAIQDVWERAAAGLARGGEVELYPFVRAVTFEVAAKALLDLDLGDELADYHRLFDRLIAGAMAPVPLRVPFGRLDRGLRARDELIRRLAPRIAAARDRPPRGMLGALAHFRDADGPLTERRIAEHLLLLFWAGYDTTAAAGSWTLLELARAPEWQARLRAESTALLGTRRMTVADGDALTAHGHVLREIERLRPATLVQPRRTIADLQVAGRRIPAGTMVFYSPYLSHRIPALFPHPEVFDPGRWDPERTRPPAPASALVGFGGGPRICLGKAFALLQLRVLLTTLLRRFELRPGARDAAATVALPTYRPGRAWIAFSPLG